MGYPKDLLSSRSIIKPGQYALIAPEGLVNNVILDLKIAESPFLVHRNLVLALSTMS